MAPGDGHQGNLKLRPTELNDLKSSNTQMALEVNYSPEPPGTSPVNPRPCLQPMSP